MTKLSATVRRWTMRYVTDAASLGIRATGRKASGVPLVALAKAQQSGNVSRGMESMRSTWLPRYTTTAQSFSPESGYVVTPTVSIPATLFQ